MKRSEMENLREQYESVIPPEELSGRMEFTMKKARREERRNRPMKWVKRVGISAAAAFAALTVAVNTSASVAFALEKAPLIGSIARIVTFREYEEESSGYEARIQIPHVEGLEDQDVQRALNERFEQYADALIAQYHADVKAAQELGPVEGETAHSSIESTYQVVTDTEQILSVKMDTVFTGASAYQKPFYYTVDKGTGKILELRDLFQQDADYVGAISGDILRQMKERMAADESQSYFIDGETDVEDWIFTRIREDQNFYIDAESRLVISFEEYEVAPGYMGAQTFTINPEAIRDILAANGPVQK